MLFLLQNIFKRKFYHSLHCVTFFVFLVISFFISGGSQLLTSVPSDSIINPVERYGWIGTLILYAFQGVIIFNLPLAIFNFLGLILFNAFPEEPSIKVNLLWPCFDIAKYLSLNDFCITKAFQGSSAIHLLSCSDQRRLSRAGATNCGKEPQDLSFCWLKTICHWGGNRQIHQPHPRPSHAGNCRPYRVQVSIRSEIQSQSTAVLLRRWGIGLMNVNFSVVCHLNWTFAQVNELKCDDWIVHLDEETLLTESCVNGIVNFIREGKYDFGQGVITYADQEVIYLFILLTCRYPVFFKITIWKQVVNLTTTLLDTYRVADDAGKLQFQLKTAHAPLLGWKGSFVVVKVVLKHFLLSKQSVLYLFSTIGGSWTGCYVW